MIPAAAAPGIERLIFSQKRSGIQHCNILELSKLLEITTFRIPEPETKRLFILHTKLLTPESSMIFLANRAGGGVVTYQLTKTLATPMQQTPSTYIKKDSTEICRVGSQI